jgi:serine/threonine protein kinase
LLNRFLQAHEAEVTWQHKLAMLQQVCGGMEALSEAKLVHRDLAARNLLVFAFDAADPKATVIKITDFGLAVRRERLEPPAVSPDPAVQAARRRDSNNAAFRPRAQL